VKKEPMGGRKGKKVEQSRKRGKKGTKKTCLGEVRHRPGKRLEAMLFGPPHRRGVDMKKGKRKKGKGGGA